LSRLRDSAAATEAVCRKEQACVLPGTVAWFDIILEIDLCRSSRGSARGQGRSSTPSRPLSTVKYRCLAYGLFPPVTSADLENGLQKEQKGETGTGLWSCRVDQVPGLKPMGGEE
jgi:hypothetical protein